MDSKQEIQLNSVEEAIEQIRKGGFVIGSPLRTLRSIRHTLTYRRYAPREAFSTIYQGFLKGLSEIEE